MFTEFFLHMNAFFIFICKKLSFKNIYIPTGKEAVGKGVPTATT